MDSKRLARESIATADDLLGRRLWQRFDNEQVVLLDKDGWSDKVAASIMGAAGEEFGVIFLRGPTSMEDMQRLIAGASPSTSDIASTLLSVSLERLAHLDERWKRTLQAAGRQGRHVPFLFVKEPGMLGRPPRKAELELLLELMQGLLAADDLGQLEPVGSMDSVLPCVRLRGYAEGRPRVSVEFVQIRRNRLERVPPVELPEDLEGLPRLGGRYLIGVPSLPIKIADDERELRAFIAQRPGGETLAVEMLQGFDLAEVASKLVALLRGELGEAPVGLPEEILFANRVIYDCVQPSLSSAGVRCEHAPEIPELQELLHGLLGSLEMELESGPGSASGLFEKPAEDDLDGWKRLDMAATEMILETGAERAMDNRKAWKRYFGEEREQTLLEPEGYGQMKISAYLDWFVLHYAATKRSKPLIEKLLADAPPAAARMLEAHRDAVPAFYRIHSIELGEGLVAEDITSGRQVKVTDKNLSISAESGMVFVACLYPAGSFHFASVAGPILPPFRVEEAYGFLERLLGHGIDEPVAPERRHLIGRLWEWSEEADSSERLVLTNTEGHALRWHTATFSVADPRAVAKALSAREDIEEIEAGAKWCWFKPAKIAADRLTLGSMELLGDSLLLEVNSRERFERACAWLEEIEGVALEGVSEKSVDPRHKEEQPLDDRLPSPAATEDLPPESLEEIKQIFRQKYFAWLDESIPALGGKTPRQACRTREGRQQVARLIRTYPDPGGIPGIEVPRDEMLRELGLLDEGEASG